MNFIITLFLFVISFGSSASGTDYNIPSSVRFTIDREESESPIIYYFSHPEAMNQNYPILVLCEGSSSKGDLDTVFFIREFFSKRVEPLQVGYLTIEKWGIDGNQVNEDEFWNHYTRSQRLDDHLKVIRALEKHPPQGWNGSLIFMGVSEGGKLVTDLTTIFPNTLATINWVGAGDWSWADEFWHFFETWKQHSSSDLPPTRKEYDALVKHILDNPTPKLSLGGMTYLYHADAFQKPPTDYRKIRSPFLVVEGTEDSTIDSCDLFVQKAQQVGAPITYFRIDGMDHWLRKRPDIIDRSFEWLKEKLQNQ